MTQRSPSHEELLAYAAGELPPEEARRVEAAIATDPQAGRTVGLYRVAWRSTADDDSVAPPEETISRLKSLFQPRLQHGGRGRLAAEWLQRLETTIASLIYDSRLEPATVRTTAAGIARFQMSFQAGEVEIDLQAEPIGSSDDGEAGVRWRLIGQVSTSGDARATDVAVSPADADDAAAIARCDERGMFTIELPAGTYHLHLRINDGVVSLPGVDLR